jgi:hypothetical protein
VSGALSFRRGYTTPTREAIRQSVARAMLLDIANDPRRPEWKSGSLYKRYAK